MFTCAIVASVLSLLLGGALWIRWSFRRYCKRMDRLDVLRGEISKNESLTKDLLSGLDSGYGDGVSGSISHNVRSKVDFSLNTIGTLPLEDQAVWTKRLYDMTYETCQRVLRNPDDVLAVTAPLNTFCKDIARKKLEIIKKLAKED